MNHYEEGINAMWDEVENNSTETICKASDEERWEVVGEKYTF